MKIENRKIFKTLSIAIGAAVAGTVITLAVLNPKSYAETSDDSNVDGLQTRRYATERDFSAVVEDVKRLLSGQTTYFRRWTVVESESENDSAIVKAEVPVVFFTDDLELRLKFDSSKKSNAAEITVNARSASRVGNSDFGENRRHVKQILKALDNYFSGE